MHYTQQPKIIALLLCVGATASTDDYSSFLSNELDLKGSTLVADYKAFAQDVPWWE